MHQIASYKIRRIVLLVGVIMLCNIKDISSQTPQQDLSKGNYLLMQKPFQIEAWSYPNFLVNGVLENRFNSGFYAASNFTSFGVVHSTSELEDYPIEVQNKPWSRIEEVHHGLSAFELTRINTLFRLQFEDDNLHPANIELVQYANSWFTYKRSKPEFDNTILSVDLPFSNYGSEFAAQLKNMVSLLKPDLILFNRYPWQRDETYNHVQMLYGWYGMLIYYRNLALKGIDGTGNIPIPFGAFTQTWFAYQTSPPSYSQMRLNHFGSLVFGAKVLSAFVYNDYPGDNTNTIKSFLFNNEFPTLQFYYQAEINRQITNLGSTLLKLQTSDIRLIPRKSRATYPGGTDIATLKWVEIEKPRPDNYLTGVTATRIDPINGENGDVFVGYFKPVHKSLDGTNTANENYFMIVNGLYGNDTVSSSQNIRLDFDFGQTSNINSLLRISRLTGKVEVVPLVKENTDGNEYHLDLLLNGGEGDLFKYNNGVAFLGSLTLTSLSENMIQEKSFLLFPNPVNDMLNICFKNNLSVERDSLKFSLNSGKFKLFDMRGRLILHQMINKNDMVMIDVKSLADGLYFYTLAYENGKMIGSGKFIKNY